MRRALGVVVISGFLNTVSWCVCNGPDHIVGAGIEDNFRGPPKPVTPSAPLMATADARIYFQLYGKSRFRRFDEDGENRLFLTSLLLPARRICSAQFEIHIRRRSNGQFGMDYNDFLELGFAPFCCNDIHKSLFRAVIWAGDPYDLLMKTVRIPLPAVELNRFVFLTEAPHYFDIMVHNDTAVDYVKLRLRFE